MRIARRLHLALLPAVLGLFLVAALAYWGQYAYRVPSVVVLVAAVAALSSFLVSWRNTKYVAARIERLAGGPARQPGNATDEIESIERAVGHLSSEVALAHEERVRKETQVRAARAEASDILSTVAEAATRAIDEVRLPLHILLANRFGDLNENQEEMLGAAQAAVEHAAALLGRVRLVAELDRGTLEPRRDLLRLDDVLGTLVPALRAEAADKEVELEVVLAPALPRIVGDRTHLQDAIGTLLRGALARAPRGSRIRIEAEREHKVVCLTLTHGAEGSTGVDQAIARRLLLALGCEVNETAGRTEIRLPTRAGS
jgi:signal transduction histidine kinase